MTTILGTAKDLGKSIAKSKEYTKLMNCQKELSVNKSASELLKEYANEKNKITSYKNLGLPVPPDKLKKFEELHELVQKNNIIQELIEAKKLYEDL